MPLAYSDEFFDTHSEPHRRRPTYTSCPCATYCVALWHPGKFRTTFETYLRCVFGFFVGARMDGDEILTADNARDLARRVFARYDYGENDLAGERLLFEFVRPQQEGVTWRLEIHREYVVVTLFTPIRLRTVGRTLEAEVDLSDGRASSLVRRVELTSDGPSRPVGDVFFDRSDEPNGVESALRGVANELLKAIAACARQSFESADLAPRIMTHLFGCVLPWTAFAGYARDPSRRPEFPDPNSRSLLARETPGGADATAGASRFLTAIWPDLKSDFLNRPRSDVVACYLQQGHALFVSSMGFRRSQSDVTPSRYLILHRDDPAWEPLGGPSGVPLAGTAAWRLSRLISRIHDLGVSRIAALRRHADLKNFAQYLSHIENELQRFSTLGAALSEDARARSGSLTDIKREFLERAEGFGESLVNRSLRSRYYLETTKTLQEDLAIIGVPGWTSYDQFLRRRVYNTMGEISSLAERYERVLETMNAFNQFEIVSVINRNTAILTELNRASERSEVYIRAITFLAVPVTLLGAFHEILADDQGRLAVAEAAQKVWSAAPVETLENDAAVLTACLVVLSLAFVALALVRATLGRIIRAAAGMFVSARKPPTRRNAKRSRAF